MGDGSREPPCVRSSDRCGFCGARCRRAGTFSGSGVAGYINAVGTAIALAGVFAYSRVVAAKGGKGE